MPFSFSTAPNSPAQKILFLGDSITHAGGYTASLETYFTTRFPAGESQVLNLGLPSETTSGLSEAGHAEGAFLRPVLQERLARVLQATKPDLIFACYGMNDGIYQPLDSERFQAFKSGILQMHETVTHSGASLIFITPPFFDGHRTGNLAYEETLAHYSRWLLGKRSDQWAVLNLHEPLREAIAEKRHEEPHFVYAEDGIHPGEQGNWLIARQILKELGAPDLERIETASKMASSSPHGPKIQSLVQRRQELLRDAWLSATGHRHPGLKAGLPVEEAEKAARQIDREIQSLTPCASRRTPGARAGEIGNP